MLESFASNDKSLLRVHSLKKNGKSGLDASGAVVDTLQSVGPAI